MRCFFHETVSSGSHKPQLKVRQRNKDSGTCSPIKNGAALKFHFASLADRVDKVLCSVRILMTIPFNIIRLSGSTVPLCLSSEREKELTGSLVASSSFLLYLEAVVNQHCGLKLQQTFCKKATFSTEEYLVNMFIVLPNKLLLLK